jgi:hypothetical protein
MNNSTNANNNMNEDPNNQNNKVYNIKGLAWMF